MTKATKVLLKVATIACCFVAGTTCRADVFDVYIAAGQSNMDGRAHASQLLGPLAPFNAPYPDVLLHYTNPGNADGTNAYQAEWVSLAPGYAVAPNYSGTLPSTPLRFGPEVSFGRAVDENTTTRRVAIIKVSRGGTNLHTNWDPRHQVGDPKGHMYLGFEQAVPAAIQALQDLGHSVEIRGMIWHQGEADGSGSGPANYAANLTEFIQAVRQDLGYPNLPFLIGELGSVTGGRPAVREAQANVAAAMDFVEFVPSNGLALSDEAHFTTPAVIELGQRFAATMQTAISHLPGDYNRDGLVNDDDHSVWRRYMGSTTDARADGNNDGVVDAADYVLWRKHITPPPKATLVQIDFNELNNGQLRDQPAGGTGLTGNWGGNSANAMVGVGNLTAPAGTNFNLTQSAGNKRVEVSLTSQDRQNRVDFATPLSGTIWGTFLVNNNNGGRAGIGINTEHTSNFGESPRLLVEGTDLVFITNSDARTVAEGVVPTSGDSLILFKMVFAPGRTEVTIDAWINPDLSQVLPAPHVSATSSHPDVLNNDFYRIAAGGWRPSGGSTPNSLVDFITLSDGPNAFTDVTGRPFLASNVIHGSPEAAAAAPEPGTIGLVIVALAAVVSTRRHRRSNPWKNGKSENTFAWSGVDVGQARIRF